MLGVRDFDTQRSEERRLRLRRKEPHFALLFEATQAP